MLDKWHKKEKPVFTGIARGVGGFAFGTAAAGGGGGGAFALRECCGAGGGGATGGAIGSCFPQCDSQQCPPMHGFCLNEAVGLGTSVFDPAFCSNSSCACFARAMCSCPSF